MANCYEVLGRPSGDAIEEIQHFIESRRLPRQSRYLEEEVSQDCFESLLISYWQALELHHLGAPCSRPTMEVTLSASLIVREYFGTDWHQGNPAEAALMRKESDNHELAWFKMLTMGLLVSSLSDDREALSVLSGWVEPWLMPEFADPPTDPL